MRNGTAAACLGALIVGVVAMAGHWSVPALAPPVQVVGHVVPTESWLDSLNDPAFWRRQNGGNGGGRAQRSEARADREDREGDESEAGPRERPAIVSGDGAEDGTMFHDGRAATFRTVCVRLCDGYYFPISFATTRAHFAHDAEKCQSSCNSPARLFVYPNPGGEPESMEDLQGQPYTALETAFLYRSKYNAACTCKPKPWDAIALARHRAYAAAGSGALIETAAQAPKSARADLVARVAPSRRSQSTRRDDRQRSAELRERRPRPEGAMMLGHRPQRHTERRAGRRSASPYPGYGRRQDWRSRAFGGL